MIANIDDVNDATRQLIPLREVDTVELIREVYDRCVDIKYVEVIYNSLGDLYAGMSREGLLPVRG